MASGQALPDREGYFDRWVSTHGGYDPRSNALVRWWLGIAYAVARPLAAARVLPDLVTVAAIACSGLAVGLAAGGEWWLLAAAIVVVLGGLLDSVDGAVAVLRDRVTRWGSVLDSTADRVSDLLFVCALWVAGAPATVCVVAAALMFVHEYVRALAAVAGMTEIGIVTVGERPTRVIVTAAFLAAAAALGDPWPALGAWAWVGLGVIGLTQLLVVVRRRLH